MSEGWSVRLDWSFSPRPIVLMLGPTLATFTTEVAIESARGIERGLHATQGEPVLYLRKDRLTLSRKELEDLAKALRGAVAEAYRDLGLSQHDFVSPEDQS